MVNNNLCANTPKNAATPQVDKDLEKSIKDVLQQLAKPLGKKGYLLESIRTHCKHDVEFLITFQGNTGNTVVILRTKRQPAGTFEIFCGTKKQDSLNEVPQDGEPKMINANLISINLAGRPAQQRARGGDMLRVPSFGTRRVPLSNEDGWNPSPEDRAAMGPNTDDLQDF
jgi:hypothetical protein